MIIAALGLGGIFIAIYLTLYKLGVIGQLSCSVGSCETVNTSRWAVFLGFPVAAWGVFFYVAVFVVTIVGTLARFEDAPIISWFLAVWSAVGLVFSGWLTYLELAVIQAICIWCVVSAVLVTAIFVLSIADLREKLSYSPDTP